MNPSKISKRYILCLACVIFTIVLMICVGLMPGADGSNMTHDAQTAYASAIESNKVTNWHSSLFLYEGIAIKYFFALFGISLTGTEVIRLMGICITALSLCSVSYLISLVIKEAKIYLLCYFLTLGIIIINGSCTAWGLDQFFTHISIVLVSTIVALHAANKNKIKILLCILILLLLWNCCSFRKNSLLTIPVVIGAAILAFPWSRNWSYKKLIGITGISSVAFAIIFMPLVDTVLPVKQTHPITPMLISDVRIAAILEGKENDLFERKLINIKHEEVDYKITAYWHTLQDKSLYPQLKKLYIQSWKEKPATMLVAKVLQVFQFYYGGRIPARVQRIAERAYPAVKSNPQAWKDEFSWSRTKTAIRWLTLFLLVTTAIISSKQIIQTSIERASFDFIHVFISSFCLIYAASFVVVTPTPDMRYLMPAICIGQLALIFWFGRLLRIGYRLYYREVNQN